MYTLQAMLAIAVKALVEKQGIREREKEVIEKKIKEAMEAAAENVRENKEGWSTGGEDSDGGAPGPPLAVEKAPLQYGSPRVNRKENSTGGGSSQGTARGSSSPWRGRGGGRNPGRKPKRDDKDKVVDQQSSRW